MQTQDTIDAEGFLKDRLIDGILKRFIDTDGIKAGNPKAIEDAAKLLVSFIGPDLGDEVDEVFDIVHELLKETRDPWAIAYEFGDALVKVAGPRRKVKPEIVALGTQRVETFTAAQSKTYLAEHRATVREGSQRLIVRRLLRNAPEVLDGLAGKPQAVALDPERLAKIISIVKTVIPILTAVSAFVPFLIPVVVVLKLIVARYDASHPSDGSAATSDRGLDLADFA
ncbi:hypothetical protein BH11PLA2_BH11PLA2_32530 [soil metagenome]